MKFAGCSTTPWQTQLETWYDREIAKCVRYNGGMLYQDQRILSATLALSCFPYDAWQANKKYGTRDKRCAPQVSHSLATQAMFFLAKIIHQRRPWGSTSVHKKWYSSSNVPWVPETFHLFRSCLRPSADEAPRHTREKISGTQGKSNVENVFSWWNHPPALTMDSTSLHKKWRSLP